MQNKNLKRAVIICLLFLLLFITPLMALGTSFDISDIQSTFISILNAIKSKLDSIASIISNLFLAGLSDAPGQLSPTATPDFTLRAPEGGVPRWWDDRNFHQDELGYVRPVVQEGLVRIADYKAENKHPEPAIVRGNVAFSIASISLRNSAYIPIDELRYRYVLHTPDANGNDIRTPLSDVLEGDQTIYWDSASIPDGTYAVSAELLGGGIDPDFAVDRHKSFPLTIIVDNTPGAITGEQWLPLIGYSGQRHRWAESFAVDWVRSTETPLSPAAQPYPYEFIAPPQTEAGRQALVGLGKFAAETWLQVQNSRFDQEGRLSQTQEGHRFIVGYDEWEAAGSVSKAQGYPFTDGQRNQASVHRNTAFRPDPTGPGFLGISYEGRLFRIHPTNGITTLAGIVTRSDVVPYSPWDTDVTTANREANQWNIIGAFDQGTRFEGPQDLAIDPNNSNIIYIADTGNHAIRKVDLSGPEAVITTFAGALGVSGFANGTGTAARFNSPWSVEIIGRTMYVTDRGNDALRAIELSTGEVTTVMDAAQLNTPLYIRQFSNGDLAILDNGSSAGTVYLKRIDPFAGTVIGAITDWARPHPFDVDRYGLVGPVDDIIAPGNYPQTSDHGVSRITPQGDVSLVSHDWGLVQYQSDHGLANAGTSGAYAISVAIDDEEPRIIHTGQFQWGVHILRPVQPGDPLQDDVNLDISNRGRDHYYAGTIREFYPNNDRPSLAALHGRKGHNYIGQLNFDDIMSWTDAQLAQYIRDGMGGGVARPELTGRDLAAMVYFIRLHSLQGKTQVIDPVQIARNLNAASFWDDLADAASPQITRTDIATVDQTTRQVQITTSEPTVAVVHYGRTTNLGLNTNISSAYSRTHVITINYLDPQYADDTLYQVRVKDQAGNQTITDLKTLAGNVPPVIPPPPPPPTPTLNLNITADPNTGTAPLDSVSLTATVSGTATGNITYTFYCNRQDTGTNITTPYDAQYPDQIDTDLISDDLCSYQNPGVYKAKVIATRQGLTRQAQTTISVTSPPENCQDADQDNINDYNPAVCPSGRDICIKPKQSLTSQEREQYQPFSNTYELIYNTQADIRDLPDFKVLLQNKAQIQFTDNLDLIRLRTTDGCFERINFDQAALIDQNKAEINTTLYPELNKPAQITFYNVTLENPVIKKDGVICQEPACRILSYDRTNHILTIEVTSFSKYKIISYKAYLAQTIIAYFLIFTTLVAGLVSGIYTIFSKQG